jgi:1-phosphofructokinase
MRGAISMRDKRFRFDAATVSLNPAIDRTVTIPNFTAGAVNRVEHEHDDAAGKGVNVASALADYGQHVAVTGFLGQDNAALFEALFAQKNIDDGFVRIGGQTRVGIKIVDPVLKQTTDINFPGPAPTGAEVAALREHLAAIDAAWFVIAGSIPPSMDVSIYRDMVTELKSNGGKVVIDASGEALRRALEAGPNVIKPNIDELGDLLGKQLTKQAEVIEAAHLLLSKGIGLVAVSMGSEGACFVTNAAVVVARPPEIEPKSTVGAGDAMVAGIVAAQLRNLPLEECARLATAFSIHALTRTESATASKASIDDWSRQVSIGQPADFRALR